MIMDCAGNVKLHEDSVLRSDGTMAYYSGTEAMRMRNGVYRLSDGTVLIPGLCLKFSDGTLLHPDGSVKLVTGQYLEEGSPIPDHTLKPHRASAGPLGQHRAAAPTQSDKTARSGTKITARPRVVTARLQEESAPGGQPARSRSRTPSSPATSGDPATDHQSEGSPTSPMSAASCPWAMQQPPHAEGPRRPGSSTGGSACNSDAEPCPPGTSSPKSGVPTPGTPTSTPGTPTSTSSTPTSKGSKRKRLMKKLLGRS